MHARPFYQVLGLEHGSRNCDDVVNLEATQDLPPLPTRGALDLETRLAPTLDCLPCFSVNPSAPKPIYGCLQDYTERWHLHYLS